MAERKSFLLRIDPETMVQLQRWADDELRSLNGQMEFVLRKALRDAGRLAVKPAPEGPPGPGSTAEPSAEHDS